MSVKRRHEPEGKEKMAKNRILDLAEMVDDRIKAFCVENNLTWLRQEAEFMGAIPSLGGKGQSAGIKVTLTFAAIMEDEPYRSALGYGSKEVATSPESNPSGDGLSDAFRN
jgi:hypothetical protein